MSALRFLIPVALLTVLALVAPASAAEVDLRFTAKNEGIDFWFEVDGYEGRNPTIRLDSGDVVHATLVNEGNVDHNLHFHAPIEEATAMVSPGGEAATLTFTVPEDFNGELEYVCDPHVSVKMKGVLTTRAAAANEVTVDGTGGSGGSFPWALVGGIPLALGVIYALGLFLFFGDRRAH